MEHNNTWRESFILRLQIQTCDANQSSEQIVRGQIVHTPSGKAWRFASLDDLTKIIQSFVHSVVNGEPINHDDRPECGS